MNKDKTLFYFVLKALGIWADDKHPHGQYPRHRQSRNKAFNMSTQREMPGPQDVRKSPIQAKRMPETKKTVSSVT